jgi:hypothetical protein
MSDWRPLEDESESIELYRTVLETLHDAGVAFVVGGTYALERLAGLARQTKDLDLFIRREDWARTASTLAVAGVDAHIEFSHWLGKAHRRDRIVDLIFAGGNGLARVDDEWITHGTPGVILGCPVHICPAEEMIWSKAFVMERERFDGADVLHIVRASGAHLDWARLLRRFGDQSSVLLSHLVLFPFVYPDAGDLIPPWVFEDLWARRSKDTHIAERLCRGTLLSRAQYLVDVHGWGYTDARLQPFGVMTEEQVAEWSAGIEPHLVSSPA